MILLDAFALIALIRGEPAGRPVSDLMRASETGVVSVNLAEVSDVLMRRDRVPFERLRETIQGLSTVTTVVPLDEHDALVAGAMRAEHYHRSTAALSIADCMVLAVARRGGHAVTTADETVLVVADREGIETFPLSRGG